MTVAFFVAAFGKGPELFDGSTSPISSRRVRWKDAAKSAAWFCGERIPRYSDKMRKRILLITTWAPTFEGYFSRRKLRFVYKVVGKEIEDIPTKRWFFMVMYPMVERTENHLKQTKACGESFWEMSFHNIRNFVGGEREEIFNIENAICC